MSRQAEVAVEEKLRAWLADALAAGASPFEVMACLIAERAAAESSAALRHAALIAGGRRSAGGRPRTDDRAALAEIERRITAGEPKHGVVGAVARHIAAATGEDPSSVARRLRRKLFSDGTVLSDRGRADDVPTDERRHKDQR